MKPGCFREGFEVTCNHSFQPPRAFLGNGDVGTSAKTSTVHTNFSTSNTGNYSIEYPRNKSDLHPHVSPVELIDVSSAKSEARLYGAVASACNKNSTAGFSTMVFTTLLAKGVVGAEAESPFLVSLVRNVLVGVGLQFVALAYRFDTASGTGAEASYLVSCSSSAMGNLQQLPSNGSCSGHGCCQASLPEGLPLTGISVSMGILMKTTMWMTNPCTFAMVVEHSWYNFSTADLHGNTSNKFPRGVPYVIDFAIRNARCPESGQQPPPDYACLSGNSSCADVTNGYVCRCLEGYEGNPYIPNGCQGNIHSSVLVTRTQL
jgi:hypothetical protein